MTILTLLFFSTNAKVGDIFIYTRAHTHIYTCSIEEKKLTVKKTEPFVILSTYFNKTLQWFGEHT